MANVPGLIIKNPISIGEDSKVFGTHYSHLGIGGFQEFETILERNSIPVGSSLHYDGKGSGRRRHLMLATVLDDGTGARKTYQLVIGNWNSLNNSQKLTELADNSNWVDFNNGIEQYIEQSFNSSLSVTVNHGWDKYPVVTLIDSSNEVFLADITYIDRNSIQIDFNQNKTGTVIVQGRFGSPNSTPATPFEYSKILFVSTNGDDGTASKGDINLPYETIEEAYNNANSGDEIWILNGQYQENQIVFDKDITFRLFGAIITPLGGQGIASNIFEGSNSVFNIKFVGQGKILNSGEYSDDSSCFILKEDNYYFEGVEISTIKFDSSSLTKSIFKNCILSYQVFISFDNIDKNIFFENCLFYNCDFITEGGSGGSLIISNSNFEVNSDILLEVRPFLVADVRPFKISGLNAYNDTKIKIKNCEFYSYDDIIYIDNLSYSDSYLYVDNSRFYSENVLKSVIENNSPALSLEFKLINNFSNVDSTGNDIENSIISNGFIIDPSFELNKNNYI